MIILSTAIAGVIGVGYILATWISGTAVNNVISASRNGLVGYWNMDSSDINGTIIYDKSGNGRDGVSNNTPFIVDGQKKEAMNFNGTNDFITISDVSDFAWGTTGDFSIVLWFFSSTTPFTAYASFVDAANVAPRWEMGINNLNQLYAHVHDGIVGGNTNITPKITNPSDGQWHQLAGVYDRDGNLTLYLDVDTTQASSMAGIDSITVATSLFIGKNDNNNNFFNDKLDDIRIYNRVLSVAEIRALYNNSKVNYIQSAPRNGLVGYWNMDSNDINGTTVYDKSGNGNNGTRSGSGGSNNTPQSTTGKIKEALDFDGTDDFISLGDKDIFSFTDGAGNDNPFSVSLWVNARSYASQMGFIVKYGDGDELEWQIASDANGGPHLLLSSTNASNYLVEKVVSPMSINEWHHVVVTYNGNETNGGIDIYIDNVNQSTISVNEGSYTGMTNSTDNVEIGSRQIPISRTFFNGSIDEVRMYNRALSSTEITNIYNATKINYLK